jgi:hypothetical protein
MAEPVMVVVLILEMLVTILLTNNKLPVVKMSGVVRLELLVEIPLLVPR